MKVLLINGSPKANGCTYTALAEVQKALSECDVDSDIFHIGTKPIIGCMGCAACRKTGQCVHNDVVNDIAGRLDEYDGIVVGSPVHYAAASGAMTSFMDRLFYSAGAKLKFKPAAAVVSCRRGGSSAAHDQLDKYFSINQMPIVSGTYWNMVHGSTPADVVQDLEGMLNMRTIGRNMAWLIKCIKKGEEYGINIPTQEEPQRTNFIR